MTDNRRDLLAEVLRTANGYGFPRFDEIANVLLPHVDRMCAEAAAQARRSALDEVE